MANSPLEHTANTAHHADALHIPLVTGEKIHNFHIGTAQITTTVFSTWIFMAVLFVVVGLFYAAIKTNAFPRVRTLGLDAVSRLDRVLRGIIGNKKYTRQYFPMLAGFFVFILLANLFGLILDYITLVIPSLHSYLRPFNADMSTTLGMAIAVILISQITSMYHKGFFTHWKHYLFHFSGNSLFEKILNVPIGWLHFVSELTRVLSLSVRLFANIFAGAALIAVMAYLGTMIPAGPLGGIVTLPIWFFEVLVAFIQAFIFMMLSAMYIQEAVSTHEH